MCDTDNPGCSNVAPTPPQQLPEPQQQQQPQQQHQPQHQPQQPQQQNQPPQQQQQHFDGLQTQQPQLLQQPASVVLPQQQQQHKHSQHPQQQQQDYGKPGAPQDHTSEAYRQSLWEASELSHPVYKKISAANGRINRMTRAELLSALAYLKLSTKGTKEVLKKRLKSYSKKQHLKENNVESSRKVGHVDYYIVIDFEATCESTNPPGYLHEIIEFPAVLLCSETYEVVSEFHMYCRPVNNPILTDFCRELTGITQLQVDSAADFPTVLRRFDEWLKQMVPTGTFCIATDGPWDIDRFLKQQCRHLQIDIPHYFHRWVNVRKHFSNFYKISNANVELMLQHLGLEFQGRPHSGIDDSRNIARILLELKKDGADVCINESFR